MQKFFHSTFNRHGVKFFCSLSLAWFHISHFTWGWKLFSLSAFCLPPLMVLEESARKLFTVKRSICIFNWFLKALKWRLFHTRQAIKKLNCGLASVFYRKVLLSLFKMLIENLWHSGKFVQTRKKGGKVNKFRFQPFIQIYDLFLDPYVSVSVPVCIRNRNHRIKFISFFIADFWAEIYHPLIISALNNYFKWKLPSFLVIFLSLALLSSTKINNCLEDIRKIVKTAMKMIRMQIKAWIFLKVYVCLWGAFKCQAHSQHSNFKSQITFLNLFSALCMSFRIRCIERTENQYRKTEIEWLKIECFYYN